MAKPVLKVASANVKMAEMSGVVTVGEESAKRLSKALGREVLPGEQFDLGTLSYYHKNPAKRIFNTMFKIKRNPFNTDIQT